MHHIKRLCTGAAVVLALLVVGEAVAQDPTGVSSELERTASTSPQEKIAYAEAANEEIREAEISIARLLEQARKDGDAEAIECLISRLTSVRALLQVSETSEIAMKDALAALEDEKANHEFRKIAVALSKTRVLLMEAERCASQGEIATGTTIVDWDTPLTEADDFEDPLDLDDFDLPLDPPEVSPFL